MVPEQILFCVGPRIYRSPVSIVLLGAFDENDESRFHCVLRIGQ
jgi:hypothetical protein